MRRYLSLWLLSAFAALLAGCEDVSHMEIDAPSTTHPTHYDREIPADAVEADDQGTQRTSEQTASTEQDSTGPAQQDSLAGAYNLDDLRGRRVLLVFAGSPDVPAYERLKNAWRRNEAAAKAHDLVLVESLLRGSSPAIDKTLSDGESQVMRSRYGVQPAQFKIVLIGKDGESQDEWGEGATFDDIFDAAGEKSSSGDAAEEASTSP